MSKNMVLQFIPIKWYWRLFGNERIYNNNITKEFFFSSNLQLFVFDKLKGFINSITNSNMEGFHSETKILLNAKFGIFWGQLLVHVLHTINLSPLIFTAVFMCLIIM